MSERSNEIIRVLLSTSEYVTIDELAFEFKVSNRTIRNDLLLIDDLLSKNNLPKIIRSHNLGAKLETSSALITFFNNLKNENFLSKKQVQSIIVLTLLFKHEYVDREYFNNKLEVSSSTIYAAYKSIPSNLQNNPTIQIIEDQSGRYMLCGDCSARLNLFINILLDNADVSEIYDSIILKQKSDNILVKTINQDLLNTDLYVIYNDFVSEIEAKLQVEFEDISYLKLLLFFDYINSNYQFYKVVDKNEFSETNEYDVATKIIRKHFTNMDENNICVVTNLLTGIILTNKLTYARFSNHLYEDIACQLIYEVERLLALKFKNIDALKISVSLHLKSMLYRVVDDNQVYNPLFKNVMEEYPDIYCAVDEACLILKKYGYHMVSPQEISFLTLHFLSAVTKASESIVLHARILIVSIEGSAVAANIKSILEQYFETDSINYISYRKFRKEIIAEYNLVVTTTNLNVIDPKIVRVHPDIRQVDRKKLEKHLSIKKYATDLSVVHEIVSVTKRHANITDHTRFEKDLINILIHGRYVADKYYYEKVLFKKEFVLILNENKEIFDGISKACQTLVSNQLIEQKYVNKINENIKKYGGYMTIAPGILLAHAGIDDGVNVSTLSVLYNKTGYHLVNQYGTDIQLIIVLALTDEHKYLDFLNDILCLTNEKDILTRIERCKTSKDIYGIFNKMEE